MITNTHEKKIKVHTIVIDDTEIERYLDDPASLIDALRALLIAKPQPDGHPVQPARRTSRRLAAEEKIPCPKCGMPVKPRGMLVHQRGAKCRARSTLPA